MTAGIILGLAAGYAAGRMHKAWKVWRHGARKVRADIREVRRGPRW